MGNYELESRLDLVEACVRIDRKQWVQRREAVAVWVGVAVRGGCGGR